MVLVVALARINSAFALYIFDNMLAFCSLLLPSPRAISETLLHSRLLHYAIMHPEYFSSDALDISELHFLQCAMRRAGAFWDVV